MTPAAVLFDFDGVLADSRQAIARSINAGLDAVGVPRRPVAELIPWIGPPLTEAFVALAGPERAPIALSAYRERYATSSLHETLPMPDALEVLAAVRRRCPTALATSKPRVFAVPLCERLGFGPHLTVIEGPTLDGAGESKAQTIGRALSALGLSPGADVVHVGDRAHDVDGAHANGIRCFGVLGGIGDRAELEAAGADRILPALSELPGSL